MYILKYIRQTKPRRLLQVTNGANVQTKRESEVVDMQNLTTHAAQVKTSVFDLSPAAEMGRAKAIARLQRLVKRDAKRGNYDLVNRWLDSIQTLETINHA